MLCYPAADRRHLAGKQRFRQSAAMHHSGWRSRGYLPHCDGAELVQHIVLSTLGAPDGVEANFGQTLLASPRTAEIVERALLHFDAERYRLFAWCVMSNHVHIVVQQVEGWPLAQIVHSWKSFTAKAINKELGRRGGVWLRDRSLHARQRPFDDDNLLCGKQPRGRRARRLRSVLAVVLGAAARPLIRSLPARCRRSAQAQSASDPPERLPIMLPAGPF